MFARTALAALITARLALSPFRELAEVPPALYDPAWVVPWRSGPPSAAVIALVQVVGVAAGIAAVARWRVRATFVVAWVALVVLAGLRTSRGKVLHNDLLLVWCAAPFLLAPVRASLARHRGVRRARVAGAGRHGARCARLLLRRLPQAASLRPRLGPRRQRALRHALGPDHRPGPVAVHGHLGGGAPRGRPASPAPTSCPSSCSSPSPWCGRRCGWFFVASAVALHVATWLLLGLDYWTWAATVLVVFVDWPAVLDRVSARRQGAG